MSSISDYIEANLTIGQGRNAGAPFKLLAWQKRFIKGAFDCEGQGRHEHGALQWEVNFDRRDCPMLLDAGRALATHLWQITP